MVVLPPTVVVAVLEMVAMMLMIIPFMHSLVTVMQGVYALGTVVVAPAMVVRSDVPVFGFVMGRIGFDMLVLGAWMSRRAFMMLPKSKGRRS